MLSSSFKTANFFQNENNPSQNSIGRNDLQLENLFKMYYTNDQKLFREYQFSIIKTCLLDNTLVCLPTGLGKTFIASTIMFNYHLWFHGKIFFFAPTKPLVNQQRSSFLTMFQSLKDIVTEINGHVSSKKRDELYRSKKIFFLTPQTLDNDLTHHIVNCETISLLIFDEAHKAQKNYAYTNIVTKISEQAPGNNFRIVGLSASPGSTAESIQNVIDGLKIRKIELRTDNDRDIVPYIFNKEIKIIEVESSKEIDTIKSLLDKLIKTRMDVLMKFKIVEKNVNVKYLGVGKLLEFQNNFKKKKLDFEKEIGPMMIGEIYQTFSLMFQLLNSKKMLITQGLDSFKESIKKIDIAENSHDNPAPSSFTQQSNSKFKSSKKYVTPSKSFKKKFNVPYSTAKRNLVESSDFKLIKAELFENNTHIFKQPLLTTSSLKISNPELTFQNTLIPKCEDKQLHPKLLKLKDIVNDLQEKIKKGSKVIIFTQFKDSAREILNYIQGCGEFCDIPFSIFTGQDKNFKQKDQLEILKKFRDGDIKVLIATSVAEEGLDIGDVDVIICYDMSSTSPIKMIQRFGRTGRKRDGLVIVLAAKGEEKSKYFRSLCRMKGIHKELKSLKYNFEGSKIKLFARMENVLYIPSIHIEHCEYVELKNEIVEELADEISEVSDGEDEEEDEEDIEEEEDKNRSNNNHQQQHQNQIPLKSYFDAFKMQTPIMKQTKCDNNKPLFSFKIFNQKTGSGMKYSTSKAKFAPEENSGNRGGDIFPEIRDIVINDISDDDKIHDSPIHLQEFELDNILGQASFINNPDIETQRKKSISDCHSDDDNDILKNLENDQEFLNQLFRGEEIKLENIPQVENKVIIPPQEQERVMFKSIDNIMNNNYWGNKSSESRKRKFSLLSLSRTPIEFPSKKCKY